MTGANFSSWYRADEGTLFAEALQFSVAVATYRVFNMDGATRTPGISQFAGSSNTGINGAFTITLGTYVANTFSKTSFAYKIQNYAASKDGAASATSANSTAIDVPTRVGIGQRGNGTQYLNGHIRKLSFYPKRLANAELQALTQV
jgi:hypothetical protein